MSEINHGPLPSGGFWAGFCSNPDCNVLGCPGDCQPSPEAQPVAPAPDTATVLAGLVELWDDEDASLPVVTNETWASEGERLGRRGRELKASARALVAQQATSGTRAAGGETPSEIGGLRAIRAAAEYLLLTHSLPTFGTQEQDTAWEGLVKAFDYAGPAAQPPPSVSAGAEVAEVLRELIILVGRLSVRMPVDVAEQLSEAINVATGALAAPPTPSAPGVAALLAECARRQETYGDEWISIWQIRRLLAPEGADEEEGT